MHLNNESLAMETMEAFSFPEKRNEKFPDHKTAIYLAINEDTKKYYIGATTNKDNRINSHKSRLIKNKHVNYKFQEAYNENSNFNFITVPVKDIETVFSIEKDLLKICRGDEKCLNLKDCAVRTQEHIENSKQAVIKYFKENKVSDETKAKQSQVALKKFEDNPELKQTISNTLKDKYKNGLTNAFLNKKHKPETIEQNRQNTKKYFEDNPEAKLHLRNINLGKTLSNETKAKISASNMGKKMRPDSVEKIMQHIRKPVSVDGKLYTSLTEVANEKNISIAGVNKRLKNDKFPTWTRV